MVCGYCWERMPMILIFLVLFWRENCKMNERRRLGVSQGVPNIYSACEYEKDSGRAPESV